MEEMGVTSGFISFKTLRLMRTRVSVINFEPCWGDADKSIHPHG